jgi:4a-hydroxytetrahydrobiopterin dehydratase
MSRPKKLSDDEIQAFLAAHPGWAVEGDALARTFSFDGYAAGIAFVVRVGFAAEARDHHPDLAVGYGRVKVTWTTHDAGGISGLDVELAERTDAIAKA